MQSKVKLEAKEAEKKYHEVELRTTNACHLLTLSLSEV